MPLYMLQYRDIARQCASGIELPCRRVSRAADVRFHWLAMLRVRLWQKAWANAMLTFREAVMHYSSVDRTGFTSEQTVAMANAPCPVNFCGNLIALVLLSTAANAWRTPV